MIRFFQERDIKQLLLEVRALEQATSAPADTSNEGDSPKLAALKLQNSKLKYRITHLKKVHIAHFIWLIFLLLCNIQMHWQVNCSNCAEWTLCYCHIVEYCRARGENGTNNDQRLPDCQLYLLDCHQGSLSRVHLCKGDHSGGRACGEIRRLQVYGCNAHSPGEPTLQQITDSTSVPLYILTNITNETNGMELQVASHHSAV